MKFTFKEGLNMFLHIWKLAIVFSFLTWGAISFINWELITFDASDLPLLGGAFRGFLLLSVVLGLIMGVDK